ncbi:IQ and ubiquitin-like domain-containing protein [Sergentomyia squamirostris]
MSTASESETSTSSSSTTESTPTSTSSTSSLSDNDAHGDPAGGRASSLTYRDVTVKFQISESQIVAHVYDSRITIGEMKRDMGSKFNISSDYLAIRQKTTTIDDNYKLQDLVRNNFGIIEVHLTLTEDAQAARMILDLSTYYSHFTLPEIITVLIPNDDPQEGELRVKEVLVEIENRSIVKPFLGGFRNSKTDVEFHHAFTQTGPSCDAMRYDGRTTRETQTIQQKSSSLDTNRERGSQCYSQYFLCPTDKIIKSRRYVSSDEMVNHLERVRKARIIQKNYRVYLWRKFIHKAAQQWRHLLAEQQRRESQIEEIYVNRFKKEQLSKTCPRTKEDFELLYAQVEKWKISEVNRINETCSGATRIAELNALLDKEIQLLNGIDYQKSVIRKELKEERTDRHLENLGRPTKWIGYRNQIIEMDTIRSQRTRFLTHFHKRLRENLTKMDRLQLIREIKDIIKSCDFSCAASIELEELFEREKRLWECQYNPKDLENLHQRQQTLFLDIIYSVGKSKPKADDTRMCIKCKNVRPLADFTLHTRQKVVAICQTCSNLKLSAIDKSIYKAILRSIRRDERQRGALASYAFIIQEDDIRFLVENIWHGHSVLSQCDNRMELRLPRWKTAEDWAPWNCICLTEAEARSHIHVEHPHRIYERNFLQDVQGKNSLALTAFRKLKEVDFDFVESGEWWSVGLDGKTI